MLDLDASLAGDRAAVATLLADRPGQRGLCLAVREVVALQVLVDLALGDPDLFFLCDACVLLSTPPPSALQYDAGGGFECCTSL